jgi:hypothetical protein
MFLSMDMKQAAAKLRLHVLNHPHPLGLVCVCHVLLHSQVALIPPRDHLPSLECMYK